MEILLYKTKIRFKSLNRREIQELNYDKRNIIYSLIYSLASSRNAFNESKTSIKK
jgi:hypothetical protein